MSEAPAGASVDPATRASRAAGRPREPAPLHHHGGAPGPQRGLAVQRGIARGHAGPDHRKWRDQGPGCLQEQPGPSIHRSPRSDPKAPLAKTWPVSQQQGLQLEQKYLAAATSSDFRGDVMARSGLEGLEVLDDVTMVVVPDLMAVPPGEKLNLDVVKAVQMAMIAHCEHLGDRLAILDAPPDMTPQEIKKWRMDTAGFDSQYAALYYPWIRVDDPIQNRPLAIPPSGYMAGIWARSDNTRGVHKAPANEVVRGAVGLVYNTTKGEQDTLNPFGINCIRAFPGMGIRVWGARTLSSNPSWRYINVRRLFNYVEKSIERGTQWVVFEPNDPFLWSRSIAISAPSSPRSGAAALCLA